MAGEYRVLDGGLATEVIRVFNRTDLNTDPLWSARLLKSDPDQLKAIHKSFLEAGSDIIETATYQASIGGFMEHLGMTRDQAHQLLMTAGTVAMETRDIFWQSLSVDQKAERPKPLVAGSLGPYGACLHDMSEYTGNYVDNMTKEELMAWHRPHVQALVDSGVDIVAFDTVPAQKEAQAILDLMKAEFPSAKAWISFVCKDGHHLAHGEPIETVCTSLCEAECPNVFGLGINCTNPDFVTSLLGHIPDAVKRNKTIIVYPNSGEIWKDYNWSSEPSLQPLHSHVTEWVSRGAMWIGGCCRVTADDVKKIAAELNRIRRK